MASRLRSRMVLSESKLADIGSVAVESTYSDQMIESLIWTLSGMQPQRGKFFTSRMQVDKKLDMLSDLGKQWIVDARKLKTFTKIIVDLKIANNERNIIIHGVWRTGISLAELAKSDNWRQRLPPPRSIRKRLRSSHEEFSARKIRGTARKIVSLTEKLRKFALAEWPHLP